MKNEPGDDDFGMTTSPALRPLRPDPELAVEALRRSLASGHKRPLLMGPTGYGKTLTAAHIIRRTLDKGNRVIFTVPALSLTRPSRRSRPRASIALASCRATI